MIMRKIAMIIVVMLASALCVDATAQSIDEVIDGLSQRSIDGVHVRVLEDASAREAVEAVEAQRRITQVSGFRVVIFSDNGQYAGDNAQMVLKEFEEAFPHINAYLVYESPYFKISVGDCLSMEEAQMLMAQLVGRYPKAFPKREDIKLDDLRGARRQGVVPRDTLSTSGVMPQVTKMSKI